MKEAISFLAFAVLLLVATRLAVGLAALCVIIWLVDREG